MGEPYPQKEPDADSNSDRECDWAAGCSGTLACVYAVGGGHHLQGPGCENVYGDAKMQHGYGR